MNLNKLKEIMEKENIDTVVTTSYQNSYYMTGNYSLITKLLGVERPAIGIFPLQGEPTYLVAFTEELIAKEESGIDDIRIFSFKEPPLRLLVDVLLEKNIASGRVGFEFDYLPTSFYRELLALTPNLVMVDASSVLSKTREIKDEKEISYLTLAAQAQRQAVEAAFELARPGDTEKHVADMIIRNMLDLGMDEIAFMYLSSGIDSLKIHSSPSERKLQKGEIVRTDCGGLVKGYYSDLARTYAIGKASNEQRRIYRALVRCQKAAIESMHVGVKISDVYGACKKLFEDNYPAPFTLPFIGHGIGVFCHEEPFIAPDNDNVLEENMIIEIEPIYFHAESFYHVEDLVHVTASGPKVLTDSSFQEEIPVIW